jgi:hypothetical protein
MPIRLSVAHLINILFYILHRSPAILNIDLNLNYFLTFLTYLFYINIGMLFMK